MTECLYYWGEGYTGLPLYLKADSQGSRSETKNSIYLVLEKNLLDYSKIDLGKSLATSIIYRWQDD
jgi:hypothetical protein